MDHNFLVGSLTVSTLEDNTFKVKFNHPNGVVEYNNFNSTKDLIKYLKNTEHDIYKYMEKEQKKDWIELLD